MLYVISLHVIFMVAWFAALFYMPRLLIYHTEADQKEEPERSILIAQFKIMENRLWNIIAWPAMILTWVFGLWTSFFNPAYYYTEPWFILKLVFVFLLTLYHLQTHVLTRQMRNDIIRWSSFRLRLWNEAATILLFAIIFLVIPKPHSGWVWGILGLFLFIGALIAAVAIYKGNREKKEKSH
jgi:protoporphyrinogen IX oxidase